ncbi:MAG: aquaporin [Bdellovibrionota bacterium]
MKEHLPEYFSEFLGTALMMLIGIGAVTIMWANSSPLPELIPSPDLRRLLTGMMFAGGATLVVLSPLGQRSGGHLNPAVTLAFWWKGQVRTVDAVMYGVAQIIGAIVGVYVVAQAGSNWASEVQLGITLPGTGYSPAAAFIAEVVITFLLVFLIFFCVSQPKLANKTPYLAGSLVAFLVFVEAPISGTSLNPARSFAPALLVGNFQDNWLYWIAPLIGAGLAVLIFASLFPEKKKHGCAKLFHTERYRCIFMNCDYANVEAGHVLLREGELADHAYVVERGELEVRKRDEGGKEVTIATLGPGDWVGEMALLLDVPRSASVVASKDCQLRAVTKANFAHVIAEHPHETEQLLKQLASRLSKADQKLIV